MIPKIINFIWMQGVDSIPNRFKRNIKSVIDKNYGYEIRIWDENSLRKFICAHATEYLRKWDSMLHMHQRVDLGRYIVLYKNGGGISVDIDAVAIRGFDETPHINDSDFIVSFNSSSGFENYIKHGKSVSLNNATILVSKNNPIMKGLLDHIMGLSCDINESKEQCIQNTTGPREFTKYLDQYKDQITVLDNTYFEPCSGYMDECEIKENTILEHRHEGSWVSDRNKIIGKLYYKAKQHSGKILIALTIIAILLLMSKTRQT